MRKLCNNRSTSSESRYCSSSSIACLNGPGRKRTSPNEKARTCSGTIGGTFTLVLGVANGSARPEPASTMTQANPSNQDRHGLRECSADFIARDGDVRNFPCLCLG